MSSVRIVDRDLHASYSLFIQNSNHNILHVLTTSIREEGAAVLFKGWTPAFVRLGPNTVFLFVFFEVC